MKRRSGAVACTVLVLTLAGTACSPKSGGSPVRGSDAARLGNPKARITYRDDSVEIALYREKTCGAGGPCGEVPVSGARIQLLDSKRMGGARGPENPYSASPCVGSDLKTDAHGVARFSQKDCDIQIPSNAPFSADQMPVAVYIFYDRAEHGSVQFEMSLCRDCDEIDLRKIEPYRTWLAGANVAKAGADETKRRAASMSVEDARKITKDAAAGPDSDLLTAIANRFCGNLVTARSGGDGEVCFNIGVMRNAAQAANPRLASNPHYAAGPFETSCKLGFVPACSRPEIERAVRFTQQVEVQAAKDAEARAESARARSQQAADDESKALAADLAELKGRCTKGAPPACAVLNFVARCDQGVSDACDSAGNAYVGGVGVAKDLDRTKSYWLRGCRVSPARCAGYGIKFNNTSGVHGSRETAEEFFELGCAGDASQCVTVGTLFLRGAAGVTQDRTKARAFFQRACDAGVASGCQSLQLK